MLKLLWADTETTGVDPVRNDVIQMAGKVIIEGEVKDEFDITCQPHDWNAIDMRALAVNGRTIDELKTFQKPLDAYDQFKEILLRYVDKYDRGDKFVLCGQNVGFDKNMLIEFAKKCGDQYFLSLIHSPSLDTMQLAVMLEMKEGRKLFSRYKLENLYGYLFDEEMTGAHNALDDIEATIKVGRELWKRIVAKEGVV